METECSGHGQSVGNGPKMFGKGGGSRQGRIRSGQAGSDRGKKHRVNNSDSQIDWQECNLRSEATVSTNPVGR